MSRKTVSSSQKQLILEYFQNGSEINEIAKKFQFTVPTITRQLKKLLGEEEFIKIKSTTKKQLIIEHENKKTQEEILKSNIKLQNLNNYEKNQEERESLSDNSFFEIAPLDIEIDLEKQKDISSTPINLIDFPKVVFMIIDSKVELQTKLLKDYASWGFLPEKDLCRNTLEIFSDQRTARRFCAKNQKIIKVPNPNVFVITSEILKRKGISRIVFDQLLISL